VGVHGFDFVRDAALELQVLVCECARGEVAQIAGSLRRISKGTECSGVKFPGFAVLANRVTELHMPCLERALLRHTKPALKLH
jgi:hypothetical protein